MTKLFEWANEPSRDFMSKGYLVEGETIEQRAADIAKAVGDYYTKASGFQLSSKQIEEKVYEYIGKGFYSLSSPFLSNAFRDRGLPISCNNVTIEDDMSDIIYKTAEVSRQTQKGAGTSGYFGKIRPRGSSISTGGKADGPVHYMSLLETSTDVISQGSVRRGNFAAYLDVDHPDIMEFLEAREGDHYIQKLSLGVCISDDFMNRCMNLDPKANEILGRIQKKRDETGYPYIFFSDTVNRNKPAHYKDYTILASNLCSEICQPSTKDESFVCCLMSMNLVTISEWFDTDAVEIALVMMDAVMEDYLSKIKDDPLMRTSYNSAKKWRAVGIGTLGYHTALQKLGYPFESEQARRFNTFAHKTIWERLEKRTKELAKIFGEPEGLKGTGRRNGTLTAIAPTTSSSFILGQVSPSIEPLAGNIVTKDLAKGKYTWKNPELEKVLESYDKNDSETWASINDNYGSVQHLDYLSDNEKLIFKTFPEISMREVVGQAADRQKYLDQSQSLNLTFHPETPVADTVAIMFEAWALGVKTLYYQRPFKNKAQATAKKLSEMYCTSCEA
jgi:ribonucleoside-diphosphate reductase alpha chain